MGNNIWKYDSYDLHRHPKWSIAQVIDIGANVGAFALQARILLPVAKIYAFEPTQETYDYLLAHAGCWGVKCFKMAMGNGEDMYLRGGPFGGWNQFYNKNETERYTENRVPSKSFSSLCKMVKINKTLPYIIKLDCEGGERFILQDPEAEDYFRHATKILIELHKNVGGTREEWREYLSRFKDTHDLFTLGWTVDEVAKRYHYTLVDELPLGEDRLLTIQLLKKTWEDEKYNTWWMPK